MERGRVDGLVAKPGDCTYWLSIQFVSGHPPLHLRRARFLICKVGPDGLTLTYLTGFGET